MVYDWSGKRDICLQKYVVERQTTEQVMKYFKDDLGFEPRWVGISILLYCSWLEQRRRWSWS